MISSKSISVVAVGSVVGMFEGSVGSGDGMIVGAHVCFDGRARQHWMNKDLEGAGEEA